MLAILESMVGEHTRVFVEGHLDPFKGPLLPSPDGVHTNPVLRKRFAIVQANSFVEFNAASVLCVDSRRWTLLVKL